MRGAGILMPVSSLSSRFGIGCFSKKAYDFIDFLCSAGQTYWQVLPFGPTGFGDSPYQAFSAFAGNPYFVCLETLCEEGLLTWQQVESMNWGADEQKVDYGLIFTNRPLVLRAAAKNFQEKIGKAGDSAQENPDDPAVIERAAYEKFKEQQADWLEDYALFMTLKEHFGGKAWLDWEEPYKKREPAALDKVRQEHKDELETFYFIQYEFQKQLDKLRAYAAKKQIQIIGDLPYYVALDSADVWAHPENFEFDENDNPKSVAGCPPDAFSPTGQLWGNPIYDWAHMKADGYSWWTRRLERNYEFCDIIRIDHFNGFESYYEIPYTDETAEHGVRKEGPGAAFFQAATEKIREDAQAAIAAATEDSRTKEKAAALSDDDQEQTAESIEAAQCLQAAESLPGTAGFLLSASGIKKEIQENGHLPIIAEDLGEVTPKTQKLLTDTGFPGMNVLEYAFDWTEYSYYMTHNHVRNSVVYTGTHDNKPVREWIEECSDHDRDLARRYIHSENTDYGTFTWDFIREAYRSVANTCIIPLWDYLVKNREARINTPGTTGGNWQWRLQPNYLSQDLANSIYALAKLYCRIPEKK